MEQENKNRQGAGNPAPEWIEYNSPAVEELLKVRADVERLKKGPHTFADVAALTRRLSDAAGRLGGYYLAVPEALLLAAEQYYNKHADAVRDALTRGGADDDTTAAVLYDYGAALCGLDFQATPQQMQNALKSCKPLTSYVIDKYGFFLGVLWGYQRNLNTLAEYQKGIKQQPDATKRDLYFITEVCAGEFTDLRAAALYWLQNIGYITAGDFAGVEQDTITRFLSFAELYGQSGQFSLYVYIAQNALNATPEQLAQLPPPPRFLRYKTTPAINAALDYAAIIGDGLRKYINELGEQVEAVLSAPTPQEREQATEQARQTAGNVVISVPENYALLMSRQLWAADGVTKDGQRVNKILPISAVINGYLARNPQALTVTPLILQKAIEGVNLLQQLRRTQPVNGLYSLDTNLTEFSELCGYSDANEQQKQQLLTALRIIDGIFLVLWKPTGQVAQRIFTLERFGLTGTEAGRLRMHVYASGFRGRPNLVSTAEIEAMKRNEKGEAKRHFRGQILSKGQKEENALMDEIFMYSDKIREAEQTGDAEQLAAAKEYRRKKFSRDRDKLRRWFAEWEKQGIISYKITQSKAGKTVYSWQRLQAPTPEELAELRPTVEALNADEIPAPDEQ